MHRGTSAVQILTGLAGMMVSRPECMTSWKTCDFSSQLTRGVNNRGQFICVRYLPNAAFVACSQVTPHGNFFVVDVALSVHRGCHNNVVIGQPERWVCLWGAIILMHVSEYQVQRSFLSCRHFDYLLQSKVVQQTIDVQTVKIPGYQEATVRITCFR